MLLLKWHYGMTNSFLYLLFLVLIVTAIFSSLMLEDEEAYNIIPSQAVISAVSYKFQNASKTTLRNYIFIKSAFRVSDSEIRLSLVKSHRNKDIVRYSYGKSSGTVGVTCHMPRCPDPFSPPCEIVGYIGTIGTLKAADNITEITIYTSDKKSGTKVPVQDVRPRKDGTYPHTLGVCLQPIYYMTDFTLIIQFFEYWLQEGATKFYIYWESFSEEVQEMLDFYVKTSGMDIELVRWSRLPWKSGETGDLKKDPNAFWFRLEVFLAIFDCLHHSRYSVKYVAQSDLDEMFYIKKSKLIPYLEAKNIEHPNTASFQFLSKRAYLDVNLAEVFDPRLYPFSAFNEFRIDKKAFHKPLYTKMIHRPERTYRVHIHREHPPERLSPGSRLRFHYTTLPESEAAVWHFRRLKDKFPIQATEVCTLLNQTTSNWENNFRKRLFQTKLPSKKTWINQVFSLGQELENCRQQQEKDRGKKCHNLMECESKMFGKDGDKFIRAKNSWYIA